VPNAASYFCHALKHPTNPTVPNRNVKKHVASAGWMKKENQTSFFGTTNLELKKHGWNETPTIGASIAKSTRITLSEIGLGNVHRFSHHNRLMGSIAFAQSALSPLQRATRGLLKLRLFVRNVLAKTTLVKR